MSFIEIAKNIAERALLIDHRRSFWSRCALAAMQLGYEGGLGSESLKGVHQYLKAYDDTPKKVSLAQEKEHMKEVMKFAQAEFEGDQGVANMRKRLAPDEDLFNVLGRLSIKKTKKNKGGKHAGGK